MSNTKNSAPERIKIYDAISKYKTINNGGKWRNNVGGKVEDKILFQSKHKFALAVENSPGYCTEKFAEAAQSNCIPIYWGDPSISHQFNPKSFINVHDYSSMKGLLETIVRIDKNHDEYLSMLNEPWVKDENKEIISLNDKLYVFFRNIFDQPIEKAFRRNKSRWGKKYIKRKIR